MKRHVTQNRMLLRKVIDDGSKSKQKGSGLRIQMIKLTEMCVRDS